MKKKTCKVIIFICLILMVFCSFENIFAMTNPSYVPNQTVTENALDKKVKESVLLDALANMINAVASLAEYFIGSVFESLTGDNIFPWADRIIFNGIGFLDINFLNPADNSLFMKEGGSATSILGEVIIKVYYTVFSLAILFLGVAVGIMAIRLAIASIAAEKAKYKKAIVNWATCIVMLFMMHYILSFVFWVNEKMVEIASSILVNTLEEKGLTKFDFNQALNSVVDPARRVDQYIQSASGITDSEKTTLKANPKIVISFLDSEEYISKRLYYYSDTRKASDIIGNLVGFFSASDQDAKIGAKRLACDVGDAISINHKNLTDKSGLENSIKNNGYAEGLNTRKIWRDRNKYINSDDYLDDLRYTAYYLYLKNGTTNLNELQNKMYSYPEKKIYVNVDNISWLTPLSLGGAALSSIVGDGTELLSKSKDDLINNYLGQTGANKVIEFRMKCDSYIWNAGMGYYELSGDTTDLIASLGKFFKRTAYVYLTETNGNGEEETVGWRASKVSISGALLYAIFIVQSLLYLLTYVRRLFYVIMLSMFGPIVVIYDFFVKSVS